MISRREFLEWTARVGGAALVLPGCRAGRPSQAADVSAGETVNDIHSQLNATQVREIYQPGSVDVLQSAVRTARANGHAVAIAGGRHSMGGQQFATGGTLIDMNGLNHVVEFDRTNGEIEVEAGMQWPELYAYLQETQRDAKRPWAFVQKQTGADRLSIGGALASNVHGRGLSLPPIVNDVAAFTIVDPQGRLRRCSRTENADLFRLAIGGYGLFGPMATVRLRLTPRHKVQRIVEVIDLENLPAMFDRRIADGFQYGDFQFATDLESDALLHRGVFSCYKPVDDATAMPAVRKQLSPDNWKELLYLAHVDRARAFQMYSSYYLSTSGQHYYSDEHQMSTYVDDYHRALGPRLGDFEHGGEMITEIYVPRADLVAFLGEVRSDFQKSRAELIYGTIRLIERDHETMLAWAKKQYACVIFNLHVTPTAPGIEKAKRDFRGLIDRGLKYGGSYYLTYHRWAERSQLLAAYPAVSGVLAREAPLRSGRALPVRLVSPLPSDAGLGYTANKELLTTILLILRMKHTEPITTQS
jgi:FAD/FMN-containing dehydrogenase